MFYRSLLVSLALHACGPALAQEVRLYGQTEAPDPQEVAHILAGSTAAAPGIKMRSLRVLDDGADAPIATAIPMVRPSALALPVQFAFDSAEILPSARRQLDALAEGIRLLPKSKTVRIEGHTDASGGELYNELLSVRRAYAVRGYLVAAHGIDPERLHAVGLGKYAVLPGYSPYAPQNRRVQFSGD